MSKSNEVPELIGIDDNPLADLPWLFNIITEPFDITKRLLSMEDLIGWRDQQIKNFFLWIWWEDERLHARQIFDFNTIPAQLLVLEKEQFESDIRDIHWKIYNHFESLQFTDKEIKLLWTSILAIYRQVVERPLVEIEAQIDQQIITIANNIMLRRLVETVQGRTVWILTT